MFSIGAFAWPAGGGVPAPRTHLSSLTFVAMLALLQGHTGMAQAINPVCERQISANVVALDQAFFWNRLGAAQPQGMMFALKRDVVPIDPNLGLIKGNVQLREGKRPRPIALRMNVGDCLTINFENLLADSPRNDEQPATRSASIRAVGLQLVNNIDDDGSNVGKNPGSLVAPGNSRSYTYYAEREGGNVLYSAGATTGGEGDGGSLNAGLFGAINVEPRGAEWYRSQVTAAELALASAGSTAGGQPLVNYAAVYPVGHPRAGTPILKMLDGSEIVHTDLTAMIAGPSAGRFPAGTYRPNATEPDREQPFREFTVIYHDETGAVQAFPIFEDDTFSHTLHSVRDGFAINYGSAGVGAEVLANRLGVGPMHDCVECKYEEFFLSAWAVGDPAMVVDVPANSASAGNLVVGPKATKALYPDDPSNVYHSYLRDHVKFRIMHGGSKEHHVHHQHAKQWLHTPDSDNSTYLDSQTLGPGSAFNLEMVHNGSGNRNLTAGDAIFHCHFYPHFAQGMWSLWRTHDVFEAGTVMDPDGRPAPAARALPDGEIAAGTPIPALVPLPTLAMAPVPGAQVSIVAGQVQLSGAGNPGYPFFVPGLAGHRPPHPPLDTIDDGGLPRHVVTGGSARFPAPGATGAPSEMAFVPNRLNFDKTLETLQVKQLPEGGTPVELSAMAFHAQRTHPSFTPDGSAASFITNGLPPQPGAPYADPCVDDSGNAAGVARTYKAAVIQTDLQINKAGWHMPQSRLLTLWGDVAATLNKTRPPEPMFLRANTNDCITFYHTALIPNVYTLDDFQVRTPTDIVGQHIHLVKFDVLASDGSGNGWNYEDGTFAPDEVRERIGAINNTVAGGSWTPVSGGPAAPLVAKPHPYFGSIVGPSALGAQTTVQRWYADNVLNNLGQDRTLRTVFTHDHFSPSTHQQAGLYAGLVIEPQGSTWRNSETGEMFGSRVLDIVNGSDGGPTSWRADILTSPLSNSYREFLLEFADFQLAYRPDGTPVNPPAKKEIGLPLLVETAANCPGGGPLPCPEAISSADVGTMSVNYRNEPIALRIRDPGNNTQAAGLAGDLSHVYRSDLTRADPAFNIQPGGSSLTGDVRPGDPFTPLLRAYENDKVQIRTLVGAHEEGHNFTVNGGIRWLFESNDPNSGFRNSQMMGISEHFEFVLPPLPVKQTLNGNQPFVDFIYKPGASVDDQWNGLWGLIREYQGVQNGAGLRALPSNPNGKAPKKNNLYQFKGYCPKVAPDRFFDITAVSAAQALPGGKLVYNARTENGGPLYDPTAILYVRTGDLNPDDGKLKDGVPVEPLILRANAGDCIKVTLRNKLPAVLPDLAGFSTLPMIVKHFNANQITPSSHVGLHAQLISFEASDDGSNVGFNRDETAPPGGEVKYEWYAGTVSASPSGFYTALPIEFGAVNLISSDPIKHSNKGAIGGLIIEPRYATWVEDPASRASATVTPKNSSGTPLVTDPAFREFVVLLQNDVNLRNDNGAYNSAVPNLAESEDAEDSGQKAVNYRTEPMWKRMGFAPDATLETTRSFDFSAALSNASVGGDPVTPVFSAKAGTPVRFRLLQPGGHQRNDVFMVHGHVWQEQPYKSSSTVIGSNPLSEWKGSQHGIGPGEHFDFLLQNGAGGKFGVVGDYLWRTFQSFQFDGGIWGLLRVTP